MKLKWFTSRSQQTCFVYCPGCQKDLVSRVGLDGAKVRDRTDQGAQYVVYSCGECSTMSFWDFDNHPAPVLFTALQHRVWKLDPSDTEFSRLKEIDHHKHDDDYWDYQ